MKYPVLIVCMGVSSCGKSSAGKHIAEKLGLKFFEADDFHSQDNQARMAAGLPLDDAMREPWIDSICAALSRESERGRNCVLACSALRTTHRQRFRETGFTTRFLFLDGSRELIADWIKRRENHFMPPSLLDSQFEALESPLGEPDVTQVAIDRPWDDVAAECLETADQALRTSRAR